MVKKSTIIFSNEILADGLDAVTAAAGGLDRALRGLQLRLSAIFNGMTLTQYLMDAMKASGKLSDELLVMRLALGKLRVAIGDAFAPIGQVVLPVINDAIFAAIRFVKSAGRIIRALFGIGDGASDAADAEDAYASSVSSAARAAQRSLASFDKLNRLQKSTGSGGSGSGSSWQEDYSLNLKEFLIFNTISNMLAPLKEIDLTPLIDSLKALKEAMKPITKQLFDGLRWAWDNIFVPIIQWSAEILLPAVIDTLSVALQALNSVIESCKPALMYLWENFLKPMGRWAGEYLLYQLEILKEKLNNVKDWAEKFPISADQVLMWLSKFLGDIVPLTDLLRLFNLTGDESTQTMGQFGATMGGVSGSFLGMVNTITTLMNTLSALGGIWDVVSGAGVAAKDRIVSAWNGVCQWFRTNVLDPLTGGFRDTGNGILGIFSGVSGGATTGMNGLIRAINRLQFTFPDWVPIFGGKKYGFNIAELTAPSIPMLAKGAVLPANKPFLAVVGDQRHGTNVEAPLTTIQEAVRLELRDMIDSNIAGQEAIAGVLRQILEAVLGISITDGDIALAADRYRSKMAVVRGSLY